MAYSALDTKTRNQVALSTMSFFAVHLKVGRSALGTKVGVFGVGRPIISSVPPARTTDTMVGNNMRITELGAVTRRCCISVCIDASGNKMVSLSGSNHGTKMDNAVHDGNKRSVPVSKSGVVDES